MKKTEFATVAILAILSSDCAGQTITPKAPENAEAGEVTPHSEGLHRL